MPIIAEKTHMRLQIMDPIEAVVTEIQSGRTTTYVGTVFNTKRTSGTILRGEGTLVISPPDLPSYVPSRKRPRRGYPLNPDLYTVEIPMPPARTYLDLFGRQIIYVPTTEMAILGGKSTVRIRRITTEDLRTGRGTTLWH